MMLLFEVSVETANLLPLDDREDSIQGDVEVCYLDVGCVDVLGATAGTIIEGSLAYQMRREAAARANDCGLQI
jgi:hypothetical protein